MDFIRFVFSSFWTWLVFFVMFVAPARMILNIVRALCRRSVLSKHGWPPAHINADGDWIKESAEDK